MKLLCVGALFLMLGSCSSPKSLYSWGKNGYAGIGNPTSYELAVNYYYRTKSQESMVKLADVYEYMIAHPGGTSQRVPPGIYAEYGYFLMQPDVQTALQDSKNKDVKMAPEELYNKGVRLINKEIELYPESGVFLTPLLTRIKK